MLLKSVCLFIAVLFTFQVNAQRPVDYIKVSDFEYKAACLSPQSFHAKLTNTSNQTLEVRICFESDKKYDCTRETIRSGQSRKVLTCAKATGRYKLYARKVGDYKVQFPLKY